ncbi:hypothetical protein CC80DRAFT_505540 [Byssothecium circinans]|uniref:ZN622/Rei1/Reh1 zinc finger C2H2-type domain-containing protein n=1 Tax=Byssothecium circinans TaxID=147558 RepID=A0A6A5TU48_9PLEO|nr:hypothetical protein CC80DRAFT_505540 [Byssothecium circinans]
MTAPLVPDESADTLEILHLAMTTCSRNHGLFIEEREKLLVDIETLLFSLHVVICGYYECIYCAAQRNSVEAIRHHMTSKKHCKLDLADEDSEYGGFYDLSAESDGNTERRTVHFLALDETRPPGTRYRKAPPAMLRTSDEGDDNLEIQAKESPLPKGGHAAETPGHVPTTRPERRVLAPTERLTRVQESDRRSLMHLPVSQQRAILGAHQKQAERMRREERALQRCT